MNQPVSGWQNMNAPVQAGNAGMDPTQAILNSQSPTGNYQVAQIPNAQIQNDPQKGMANAQKIAMLAMLA